MHFGVKTFKKGWIHAKASRLELLAWSGKSSLNKKYLCHRNVRKSDFHFEIYIYISFLFVLLIDKIKGFFTKIVKTLFFSKFFILILYQNFLKIILRVFLSFCYYIYDLKNMKVNFEKYF